MSEHEIDRNPTNSPSDDVESLYSWANLSGAKYRDFSSARAVAREQVRTRLQTELEEKAILASELEKQALYEERTAYAAEQRIQATSPVQNSGLPPAYVQQSQPAAERAGLPSDFNLPSSRPAWLYTEPAARQAPAAAPPVVYQTVSEETQQQAKDATANRWFALKGVFTPGQGTHEVIPPTTPAQRVPAVAVFSLAGGVGKTSLVATLARSLSARGERILLIDTAPYGLLPFYFGARDQRPGLVRTFTPPSAAGDAPIQMVSLDPEGYATDAAGHDALLED